MSAGPARDAIAIDGVLAALSPAVQRVDGYRWRFPLSGRHGAFVTARLEGEWLVLESDVEADVAAPWEILRRHGAVSGPAKLCMPRGTLLTLIAEIPLDADVDLARRVREACSGFVALGGPGWDHAEVGPREVPDTSGEGGPHSAPVDLPGLLTEAGWPFVGRRSGRFAVDLDVVRGSQPAIAGRRSDGSIAVSIEMVRAETLSDESRHALGALLLTTAGLVRMVRATAKTNGLSIAGLEVCFDTPPTARELGHALSALSVAHRQVGREGPALQHETIARGYLAARGLMTEAGPEPAAVRDIR